MVDGKLLYRNPYVSDKLKGNANHIFPEHAIMKGSGTSTWLSKAIHEYLPDEVPDKDKSKLSSVSLRIGGITEMGVGNVGFYPINGRSSHTIGTNQENYFDRHNIKSSLEAAQCLHTVGAWADYNTPVYSPVLVA